MKIVGLKMEIEFDNVEKMIIRDFLIPEIRRMPLRNKDELNGRDKLVGESLWDTFPAACGVMKWSNESIYT